MRCHLQNHPHKFHFALDTKTNQLCKIKPRGDLAINTIQVNEPVTNLREVIKIN